MGYKFDIFGGVTLGTLSHTYTAAKRGTCKQRELSVKFLLTHV